MPEAKAKRKDEAFSLRKCLVVFRMLFQDKAKLSFKGNLKGSLIKLFSFVLLFAGLSALSYLFYYLVTAFSIFSVIPYVPLPVPSIIMSFLLIFGFLSLLSGLTKSLFESADNHILLTYPCSGSTVFFARLLVYYVYELLRNIAIQVPLLYGFMITMGAPFYMYLYIFPAFAFISLFEVMLASLLSIPYYLVSHFLNEHRALKMPLIIAVAVAFCGLFVYLVMILPDTVDIFTNWGYYFRLIQQGVNGYKQYLYAFYCLTNFAIGDLSGFSYISFPIQSLYAFLTMLGSVGVIFLFITLVLNPYYLRLSSMQSAEKAKEGREGRDRSLSPLHSQLLKEALLIKGGESSSLLPYVSSFLILPFLVLAVSKFFHGMDLSGRGEIYVETIMLLSVLLISLASTAALSHSFSDEGGAYFLTRTYPRSNRLFLLSKMAFPGAIGVVSLLATTLCYGLVYGLGAAQSILFFLSTAMLFIGCCLAALSFDFVHPSSNFLRSGSQSKAEIASTILCFVTAAAVTALFYLYRIDGRVSSYIKLLVISGAFFAISASIFALKSKYLGKEESAR